MTMEPFDLGLTEEDERAVREARSQRPEVGREVASRLFRGAPFILPGHEDDPDS